MGDPLLGCPFFLSFELAFLAHYGIVDTIKREEHDDYT